MTPKAAMKRTLNDLVLFFQAEDGIRDDLVTGVQTCALPISGLKSSRIFRAQFSSAAPVARLKNLPRRQCCWLLPLRPLPLRRSEERRVGKEIRSRLAPNIKYKNKVHGCT